MDSGIGSKEHPTLGAGPNGREAAGREAAGMEAIGRRATGWEATGREATGREAIGREAIGREAAGMEAIGRRATGWEATGREAIGRRATGWEATGREATGREAIGREAAGMEAIGRRATGWEATGREAIGREAAGMEAIGRRATGWEATGMEAIGRRATGWGARNCGDLLGVSRGERSPDGMNPGAIDDGGGQMAEYQLAFPDLFQPLQSNDIPSYELFDQGPTRAALARQPSLSSASTFSGSGTPGSSSSRRYAELHARLHPEGAYQQESYMGTGATGRFLNRDGSSAQRQPRVYGHSASDCAQCIGFLTDSVQDATDLKRKKDEIIHELMPNAQNFQQKSIKGLAGYLKAGTDIQIRLLCGEPFRGNFDNTCVHQLIRLIKTKGKRLGHLVEYFSQEHSLRVDILRLVQEIHSNCPFCQAILQQWC